MRVKRGVTARAKHKKVLADVKGMQHKRRSSYRMAKQGRIKALMHAYVDRRDRKNELRKLWIKRINNAARLNNTSYAKLIAGLKAKNIKLNRKVLAEIAVSEPKTFSKIVKTAK